ncbi:MAG: lipopolysaccharide biosynthesis protein [Gemmatimonadota bacterium]
MSRSARAAAIASPLATEGNPDPPGISGDTLTRRAKLTFAAGLAQHGARLLTGLLLTPFMIRELGVALYGAWVMIQQALGWIGLTDMRPMGTLKFTLGVEQHIDDGARKRRQVGAAVRLWVMTLPLTIGVGIALVTFAPDLLSLPPAATGAVRSAVAVAVIGLLIDRVVGLPASVLRGVNLDFKGAVPATLVIVAGAALTALALSAGYGLVGVATATVMTTLIASIVRLGVARRHVAWLGVEKPTREEFRKFYRLSAWLMAGGLSTLLFLSSDLLIIGVLIGPAAAAVYATTGIALRMIAEPLTQLLTSGNAGLAGLCGREEWQRVAAIRRELWLGALGSMTVAGVTVILINGPFLQQWIGPDMHAGVGVTALLVLLTLQVQLVRVECVIADAMMMVREKTLDLLVAGTLGAVAGALLTPTFGLAGMAAGTVVGRMWSLVALPRRMGSRLGATWPVGGRVVAVSTALIGAALWAAPHVPPMSWPGLVVASPAIAATAAVTWASVALAPATRTMLLRRLMRQSVAAQG